MGISVLKMLAIWGFISNDRLPLGKGQFHRIILESVKNNFAGSYEV